MSASAKTPQHRPALRTLPPLSMPMRRTLRSSMLASAPVRNSSPITLQTASPSIQGTPQREAKTSIEAEGRRVSETPNPAIQTRLEEAKALMQRIRLRASDRQSTDRTQLGIARTSEEAPMSEARVVRPPNPTPMAATLGHGFPSQGTATMPVQEKPQDGKEDQEQSHLQGCPEEGQVIERDGPLTAQQQEQSQQQLRHDGFNTDEPGEDTLHKEELDIVAPLPHFDGHAQAAASIRLALSSVQVPFAATATSLAGSSTASGSLGRQTFATAPLARPHIPRPESFSSQASSDRFFTSTSTRLPSGSTAATSLIASQAGSIKQSGIVYITPEQAEQVLTSREALGDMVYDEQQQRWVKQKAVEIVGPGGLSPIEEVSMRHAMLEEQSEDDPFRDMTNLDGSSKSRDHSRNSSQDRTRSGSLVLVAGPSLRTVEVETNRRIGKTSTPPLTSSTAVPLVSPDLPGIAIAGTPFPVKSITSIAQQPPRSALKVRETSYSTPMPATRITSGDTSKQGRSVSFSDGRLSGKLAVVQEHFRDPPAVSALRHELQNTGTNVDGDNEDSNAESGESEAESFAASEDSTNPLKEKTSAALDPAALASTIIRPQTSRWHPSHAMPDAGSDFDAIRKFIVKYSRGVQIRQANLT